MCGVSAGMVTSSALLLVISLVGTLLWLTVFHCSRHTR